jgi:hypothetical protein
MSTALAIASVTQVLKDLLNNGLNDHDVTGSVGRNVTVTALPPDRIDTTATNEPSQLNLFMYQATPNPGWRNEGYPSHNGRGERIRNPDLALDLHYLLTAYGASELHTEIVLGYGMQLLHEKPVLTRDDIRRALAPPSDISGTGLPAALQALSTSELAEQVEQIKITLQFLSTEEISKLWAAFQAKYRPTAAYQATVVLIESHKSTKPALPVLDRRIYVLPFHQPVIDQIKSQAAPGEPIVANQKILAGYRLVLAGRQLKGDLVTAHVDGTEVTPSAEDISDSQVIFPLPSTLPAGIHGVQIVHQLLMGSPEVPHAGVASNVASFVLHPRLETIAITNVQGAGTAPRSADITLSVNPAIGESQRVILLLNEINTGSGTPPHGYSFQLPAPVLLNPPGPKATVTVAISGVKAGTYLVRLQVNGAESPLDTDAAGKYNGPQVVVP